MVRMGGGFNGYFAFGSGRAFGGGAGRLGCEFYGIAAVVLTVILRSAVAARLVMAAIV